MYLHVQTSWPCWRRNMPQCDGTMIVMGEDNFHSVSCSKCGYGAAGAQPLPESYFTKLVEDGYIRRIAKRAAEIEDLQMFFATRLRHRSALELAGDLLETYEVLER